ncbi:Uncharacterised protein [Clostridioides difficile]|nr:Uncharacterised protein [Clostridioides difficile]
MNMNYIKKMYKILRKDENNYVNTEKKQYKIKSIVEIFT